VKTPLRIDSLRIESLTIALRPAHLAPATVNEKIGNRQFWAIKSLTIGVRLHGSLEPLPGCGAIAL
jgi:hypothetical protein